MPELLEALILGLIQGLTEFLPVSSSGHLEIARYLIGNDDLAEQSLMTSVILHFATALATVVVFRKDVWRIVKGIFSKNGLQEKYFVIYIGISMIPAALAGFFMEDFLTSFFGGQILFVAFMLFVTAIILFVSDMMKGGNRQTDAVSAFVIGLSQAVALLPGISRSGATIGTALLLGIDRDEAARFSFLMVVPLIFGKIARDILAGGSETQLASLDYLVTGFLAAFIAGFLACKWMVAIVRNAQLKWFAWYCLSVSILILLTAAIV